MAGDTGGLEDILLPELFDLARGKKEVPSWIHNNPGGSVNHKAALFACRYLAIGQKKEILDWLNSQEANGHMSYHASDKNPSNEFGSSVYSWMHEFVVVVCLLRSRSAGDRDVESLCLRWLAFHLAAHRQLETPNGVLVLPGCRCKRLDSISRQFFHFMLTDRPIPHEFLDRWDKWALNRGNWNCYFLRILKSQGLELPNVGFPRLFNPIKIAKWDHGHAAYYEKLNCANGPLWYAEVDYTTGQTKYLQGDNKSKGGSFPYDKAVVLQDREFVEYGA